jgi:hypothetical protein
VNGVWRNIWPHVVTDSPGLDPEEEIGNLNKAIINVARFDGFEGVDEASVEELFQSYMEELSSEHIL